jgi:histidinol-phosphate aminotransferase
MDNPLLRQNINEIKDYVPGKNPTQPGMVKLASNENPFGPSPMALEAIAKESKNLHIYPDQKSILVREALAKKFSIPEECIICGNGADDIMQILGATYLNPGDEVVISKNTFSVYELVARLFDGKIILVDLKDFSLDLQRIAQAISQKTKIIFLTNPNNPTGTIFKEQELKEFLSRLPSHLIVVVDEAYMEFSDDPAFPDSIKFVREGRSLVILRTFSKFYGLAGLRAGYGIGPKEIISPLFRTKMPFNVNRLAQVGAIAALEDKEFLAQTYQNNIEGKRYLYSEFDKLGIEYNMSCSNFIFINLQQLADGFFIEMMRQGVIIRPLTSFGFPEAIRVSVGTMEQNKKFVKALREILRK